MPSLQALLEPLYIAAKDTVPFLSFPHWPEAGGRCYSEILGTLETGPPKFGRSEEFGFQPEHRGPATKRRRRPRRCVEYVDEALWAQAAGDPSSPPRVQASQQEDTEVQRLRQKVKSLQAQLEEAQADLEQALLTQEEVVLVQATPLLAARRPLRPSHQSAEASHHSDSQNAEPGCNRCGKSGHEKKNCKFRNKKCWVCGNTGHLKAMCPKAQRPAAPWPLDVPTPSSKCKLKDVEVAREGTAREEGSQPASGEPGQATTRAGRRTATVAEAPDTGVRDQPQRRLRTRRRRRPKGQDVERVQDSRTISPQGGASTWRR